MKTQAISKEVKKKSKRINQPYKRIEMTTKELYEVKAEIKRFSKKLEEVLVRLQNDDMAKYGCKETGAIRRAALDLKNELTKIT